MDVDQWCARARELGRIAPGGVEREPPSQRVVVQACALIRYVAINAGGVLPARVSPVAGGGLSVYYRANGRDVASWTMDNDDARSYVVLRGARTTEGYLELSNIKARDIIARTVSP